MNVKFINSMKEAGVIWLVELGQVRMGLCPNSGWKIIRGEEIKTISEPNDIVMMLPLLEVGRQKIYEHLAEVGKIWKDVDAVGTFPETMLLKCAFECSVSDYWPIEGLKWLETSPKQLKTSFEDDLVNLQKHSWATQSLKQKIKRILKRNK